MTPPSQRGTDVKSLSVDQRWNVRKLQAAAIRNDDQVAV